MKQPSRVSDCRPEPPTPTSIALPRSCRRMREMRTRCFIASSKNTRFIGDDESMLLSSR